jgi:hypothetical protein
MPGFTWLQYYYIGCKVFGMIGRGLKGDYRVRAIGALVCSLVRQGWLHPAA